MNSTNYNNNKRLSFFAAWLLGAMALFGLQACSSGGSTPAPVVNADPTGYYFGTAAVKDADGVDVDVQDFQGMMNADRFIAFSDTLKLVYDGTITSITANDFTANVTVYKTDTRFIELLNTTTISGTITEGSQMTGTIEGTAAFNGTFELVFGQSNNTASDVSTLLTQASELWRGQVSEGAALANHDITFLATGSIENSETIPDTNFVGCVSSGALSPVNNNSLFTVLISFSGCTNATINNSDFTGLATIVDEVLVMVFSDGVLVLAADYNKTN